MTLSKHNFLIAFRHCRTVDVAVKEDTLELLIQGWYLIVLRSYHLVILLLVMHSNSKLHFLRCITILCVLSGKRSVGFPADPSPVRIFVSCGSQTAAQCCEDERFCALQTHRNTWEWLVQGDYRHSTQQGTTECYKVLLFLSCLYYAQWWEQGKYELIGWDFVFSCSLTGG